MARLGLVVITAWAIALPAQQVWLGDAPRVDWTKAKPAPEESIRTAGTGNWIDTSIRSEVATAWNSSMVATESVAMGWTGTLAGCVAGTTSDPWRAAVATRINWYRGMAGVPTGITFNNTWYAQDMEAALMMSANKTLNHTPPTSWTCYTAAGAEAAGKSNICYGTGLGNSDPGCVTLYMNDFGANNTAVGHRRWILYPQTQQMATGDVAQTGTNGRGNAMWVIDGNFGSARPATRDEFVAWPPKGYVPYQTVFGRWSFSYPAANFTNATVSMVRNGGAVSVTKLAVANGYGDNTVVWETGSLLGVPGADSPVDVTISNVVVGGQTRSFSYRVIIFDPSTAGGPPPPPEGLIDVTIDSVPSGLAVNVDGTNYVTPRTFSWVPGASHTLNTTAIQDKSVAGERFVFANWTTGTAASQTITPQLAGTYTATFTTQYRLQTAVAPVGSGAVTATPNSADGYYNSGSSVTLNAAQNAGFAFANWSGDAGGVNPQTSVTMTKPSTATANFGTTAPTNITVNFNTVPSGLTVAVDGTIYTTPRSFTWVRGSSHSLNVTASQSKGVPGERFIFDAWSGGLTGGVQTVSPTADITYTANFVTQYLLQTNVVAPFSGLITVTPQSADNYYASGQVVTLNAGANPSFTFSNWSGDVSGTNAQTTLTITKPSTATAVFTPNTSTNSGLHFIPVTPCRIADTREPSGAFGGPVIAGGATRSFPIPQSNCGIPSTAKAYSLNVTVVPTVGLGYLTIWPTGQTQPFVSTLNANDAQVTANAAFVPAGSNGAVSVYATNTTHVIVDINGYFDDPGAPNALAFYPLAAPCRIADTRGANGAYGGPIVPAGGTRTLDVRQSACGLPAGASAYAFNVTVVPPGALGYITAWPAGQAQPLVSTTNSYDGQVTANMAIVPAGSNGAVSFFASNQTHLIVDVTGYFAAPGGAGALKFYPVTPCRIADSRSPNGALGGPVIEAGAARSFPFTQASCGLPVTAQAYSANFTVVPAGALGYLTTWPTGAAQPFASTLNSYNGQITANAALVRAGTGGAVSVFGSDKTHVVIDTNGYFAQ